MNKRIDDWGRELDRQGIEYELNRKNNNYYRINCPFHGDKRSSATVHVDKGYLTCFEEGCVGYLPGHEWLKRLNGNSVSVGKGKNIVQVNVGDGGSLEINQKMLKLLSQEVGAQVRPLEIKIDKMQKTIDQLLELVAEMTTKEV